MKITSVLMSLSVVGYLTFGTPLRSSEPQKFLYVALGASDATGVGAGSATHGYVLLIEAALAQQFPELAFVNLGIAGARLEVIREQLRNAKEMRMSPQLVTLWTGANDLVHGDDPQMFQATLRTVLRMLREQKTNVIVIGNLPDLPQLPLFRQHPSPMVTCARVEAFNRAIEMEARAVGALLVDLSVQPVRDELIFHDGFHPNEAGHQELAELFLSVIRAKLGVEAGLSAVGQTPVACSSEDRRCF